MERTDIERITRMEEKIDNLNAKVDKFLESADDYNSRQYECEKKFVKVEDFRSHWNENMTRYQSESLQRKNNYISFINNAYKLIVTVAVIILTFKQFLVK